MDRYTNFKVLNDGRSVSFENEAGDRLYEYTLIPDDSPLNNATAHRAGDTIIVIGTDGNLHTVTLPPEVRAALLDE